MSEINLNELSLAELKRLEKDVAKAISTFESRKKAVAIAALEERAKELGFKLEDLTGLSLPKTRASAAAKFINPEDPSITWSGRGRQPQWLREALEAGKTLEDFAV